MFQWTLAGQKVEILLKLNYISFKGRLKVNLRLCQTARACFVVQAQFLNCETELLEFSKIM